MRTFRDLQQAVLRYFDLGDETDITDVELVKDALNRANTKRSTEDKWKFMLSPRKTLSVVAAQQSYILPHFDLLKLHYLYSTTHNRWAFSIPTKQIPYSDISFNQTADGGYHYSITGSQSPVKTQPTAASTLTVSSSVSETSNPTLYVEGTDSNDEMTSETIAVGTGSVSFKTVQYVAKVGTFAGTVTLATSSPVTTLLVLTATTYAKQYPILEWAHIPNESETFIYRYFRKPRVMSRDHDQPDLPFPYSELLVYDALLDMATYSEIDSESVNLWREKQQEFLNILYQEKLEPDTVGGIGNYSNATTL
jgi:hypothetical protein